MSIRKGMWSNFVSVVVVFLFVFSSVYLPGQVAEAKATKTIAEVDVGSISVPSHIGSIAESYEAPGATKLVVHIQDAHCNYSAQKNIQSILENVSANNNVSLIGVEAAKSWMNTSLLNSIPGAERRATAIDDLMSQAIINGSTAFAGNQAEIDSVLYGVESRELYMNNLKAYVGLAENKEEMLAQVANVKDGLSSLKSHILNEKLLSLINKKAAYTDRNISFSQYLSDLAQLAKENSVSLANYPNVGIAVKSTELEDGIDFAKVNEERTELINDLSKSLPKEDLGNLVTASLQFRTGKLDSKAYYSYLETVIPKDRACDNLRSYIEYVKINGKLDSNALGNERKGIEKELIVKLTSNENETAYIALVDKIDLVQKLVSIKLIREEYQNLLQADLGLQIFLSFIYDNSKKFNTGFAWTGKPKVWEKTVKAGIDFYAAALKRENAFVENLVSKMDESSLSTAALILGGFHSSKVKELLKEKNISYVVVRPRVTDRTPAGLYQGQMNRLAEIVFGAHTFDAAATVGNGLLAGTANYANAAQAYDALRQHGLTGDNAAVHEQVMGVDLAQVPADDRPKVEAVVAKLRDLTEGQGFLWTPSVRTTDEAKAKELDDEVDGLRGVKGLLEYIGSRFPGIEVVPVAVDPNTMQICVDRAQAQLEVSVPWLRMLVAVERAGEVDQAETKLILDEIILAHEADHNSTARIVGNPVQEEARVARRDVVRLLSFRQNHPAAFLKYQTMVNMGEFDTGVDIRNVLADNGLQMGFDQTYAEFVYEVSQIDLSADEITDLGDAIAVDDARFTDINTLIGHLTREKAIEGLAGLPAPQPDPAVDPETIQRTDTGYDEATVISSEFASIYVCDADGRPISVVEKIPSETAELLLAKNISSVVLEEGISMEAATRAIEEALKDRQRTIEDGNMIFAGNLVVYPVSRFAEEEMRLVITKKNTEADVVQAQSLTHSVVNMINQQESSVHNVIPISALLDAEGALDDSNGIVNEWKNLAQVSNVKNQQAVTFEFVDDQGNTLSKAAVAAKSADLAEIHTDAAPEGALEICFVDTARHEGVARLQANGTTRFNWKYDAGTGIGKAMAPVAAAVVMDQGFVAAESGLNGQLLNYLKVMYQIEEGELSEANIRAMVNDAWSPLAQLISSIPLIIFNNEAYKLMWTMVGAAA